MPTRIGDLIDKAEASEATANDKAAAAVAANQDAVDARAVAVQDKQPLAKALAKLGEITKPLPDGRFKTFTPSTTSPDGYRTEVSGGVDTLVPDDEAPADGGTGTDTGGNAGPDAGGNPVPDNGGTDPNAPADNNPPADGAVNPPVFQ